MADLTARQRRLIRVKARWTRRPTEQDSRGVHRSHYLRRLRLHRVDLLLEREGLIDPPNSWHPDAEHRLGRNANYRLGRTLNFGFDVIHFTVGTNSADLIQNRGLAHFLYPTVGRAIQFAPDDAVCAHACEANIYGVGHEREALSDDNPTPTPDQKHWLGVIVRWRMARKGLQPVHRPRANGRLPVRDFPNFHGFADHGALQHIKCDQHTDGIQHAVMLEIFAAAPSPDSQKSNQEDLPMVFHVTTDGRADDPTKGQWYLAVIGVGLKKVSNTSVAKSSLPRLAVAPDVWKALIVPATTPA